MSATHNVTVTGHDTALLRLLDLATNDNAIAAAIVAGGTGYTVGDILTVSGGTVVNSLVATLEVLSVAAGVIDGIRVFNCGAYSAQPGNPVAVTGGTGGDDATFTLTFETQNWAINRNDASSSSVINNVAVAGGVGTQVLGRELLLQGPGNAGADEIYVGFLGLEDTDVAVFNWQLFGFTGFNGSDDLVDQPGFSYVSPNEIAAFTQLTDGSIELWIHTSPRVLSGVARIGGTYTSWYVGFLNPFATPTEYPYPLYLAGSCSKWNQSFTASGLAQSGLADPGASTISGGNTRGPAGLRFFDGTWQFVKNWSISTGSRVASIERCVYPAQNLLPQDAVYNDASKILQASTIAWDSIIPSTGNPGFPQQTLRETEDSGGDITILVPTIVWSKIPSLQILGELDSVFWGSTAGNNILAQDRVIVGGVHYRAFQSANRSEQFAFFFLREDA